MQSKRLRRSAFLVFAALALLGTLLLIPRLVGRFCANAGMVLFYGVALDGAGPAPHYPPDIPPGSLEATDGWLAAATTWAGDDAIVQRALGRLALYAGDARLSWQTLQPLQAQAGQDPLLYVDLLAALSGSGQPEEVIAWVESHPAPVATSLVSDTLYVAYLEAGLRSTAARAELLEKARTLRPAGLYGSFLLWEMAQDSGDLAAAQRYEEELREFPLDAVAPGGERLLAYEIQAVPHLWTAGLWERDTVLRVVAYLVWQRPDAPGVEALLDSLTAGHPQEADWPFYRGELHQRRGHWESARRYYLQALGLDPDYAAAYLRLGVLAEAQAGTAAEPRRFLEEAARWYRQYRLLVPEDLQGLKRLARVLVVLGDPTGWEPRENLAGRTGEREIVAGLLGIAPAEVGLGPNLLANGNLEQWSGSRPASWAWSAMFNRAPFAAAAFAGGPDPLLSYSGQSAARVDGLWVGAGGESAARAGFWYYRADPPTGGVVATENAAYVLSFYYRTRDLPDDQATVWVSSSPVVLWAGDHGLPATEGAWYYVVAVGRSEAQEDAIIRPLLRTFAPGTVMFDDIGLWVLDLPAAVAMDQPLFAIVRADD